MTSAAGWGAAQGRVQDLRPSCRRPSLRLGRSESARGSCRRRASRMWTLACRRPMSHVRQGEPQMVHDCTSMRHAWIANGSRMSHRRPSRGAVRDTCSCRVVPGPSTAATVAPSRLESGGSMPDTPRDSAPAEAFTGDEQSSLNLGSLDTPVRDEKSAGAAGKERRCVQRNRPVQAAPAALPCPITVVLSRSAHRCGSSAVDCQ